MKKLFLLLSIFAIGFAQVNAQEACCVEEIQTIEAADSECSVPLEIAFFSPWQTSSPETSVEGVRLNLIYGENASVRGLDIGLFNATHGDVSGLEIGIANFVCGDFTGYQVGAVNSVRNNCYGVQYGLINMTMNIHYGLQEAWGANFARCIYGAQLGFLNIGHTVCGMQVGFINYADTLTGVQIGLLNIQTERCYVKALPIINVQF